MNDRQAYEFENRDIKQAASVSRMVELGKFPQEFTAYGCSFWESGQQKYFVSAQAETVYDFIYAQGQREHYPTVCEVLDRFFLVPAGCKDYFAQKVKLELAEQLQEHYPEGFMCELSHFAERYANDDAEPILSHLQKRLWGKFQADDLQLFGALTERAYRRRNLLPQTYEQYRSWLQSQLHQIADDAAVKDIFEKTLYGVVYYNQAGRRISYFNADRATLYRRMEAAESQYGLVSPLFQKTYWYNYQYRLYDVRQDFARYLDDLLDETYFAYLQAVLALPSAVALADYRDLCQKMLADYGQQTTATLERYGLWWGTAAALAAPQ